MEYRLAKIFVLLYSVILMYACETIDLTGMFISTESVDDRFAQSLAWNNTLPPQQLLVPSDEYLLIAMTDSHIGDPTNLDTLCSRAKKQKAVAVVMVGDLTTGKADQYEVLSQHIPSQDSLRTFQMVGNHELYFGGWKEFYKRFGSSMYYFTIKSPLAEDLFICLDSGSGTLGRKQLSWLKNLLELKRNTYRRCVVFSHNNLYRIRHTGSTNPLVDELLVLSELFLKHRVDMVITGHDHVKNELVFGNTIHITMQALLVGMKDAGYFHLNVKKGIISYSFEEI
jgi:predicted phosphodiesterase